MTSFPDGDGTYRTTPGSTPRRFSSTNQPAAAIHPRNDLNALTGTDWIKFTKTWFVHDAPPRREEEIQHPAKYPETMVIPFLEFFTKPGAWVLDPFSGVGSTLVACRLTGRNGVGIEIVPKYASMARSRLGQHSGNPGSEAGLSEEAHNTQQAQLFTASAVRRDGPDPSTARTSEPVHPQEENHDNTTRQMIVKGDATQLLYLWESLNLPPVDFAITSPPYWNMLTRSRGGVKSVHKQRAEQGLDTVYSSDTRDLGNIADYELFIEKLGDVFDAVHRLTRSGKYLVVVCQNMRTPGGEVKPFAWDLTRRLSRTWLFQGERIWCQDDKQLGIWGYPRVFVPNYHHHYCLVFRKAPITG